jgi:hypothetical protein
MPDGEEERRKPGQGPFWRKQESAAKYGARVRCWRTIGSDGNTSQVLYVPNARKDTQLLIGGIYCKPLADIIVHTPIIFLIRLSLYLLFIFPSSKTYFGTEFS